MPFVSETCGLLTNGYPEVVRKQLGAKYFPVCGAFFVVGRFVFRVILTICSAYTIWDNHPMYKNNNSRVIWMFHFSSMCVFFIKIGQNIVYFGNHIPRGPHE